MYIYVYIYNVRGENDVESGVVELSLHRVTDVLQPVVLCDPQRGAPVRDLKIIPEGEDQMYLYLSIAIYTHTL